MARSNWKVEALRKAKLEAEKGEFISHEAMGAWIHSPGIDEELPVPEIDVFKNPGRRHRNSACFPPSAGKAK